MQIITYPDRFIYVASTGDWRISAENGRFIIMPQVGQLEYSSGANLDNLAALIIAAKAHAVANGIAWSAS